MLTRGLLFFAFFHALAPVLAICSSSAQNDMRSKLDVRVHDYRLEADGFVRALTTVATDFQIPMGIEWVETKAAEAKLSISWKDGTVEGVIRAIIKTRSGYELEIRKNSVHIYAPKLIPEAQNFLRSRLNQFEVRDVPVELASRKLRELVKMTGPQSEKKAGHKGEGVGGSLITNVGDPRISVKLSDVTVQDILDALVVASPRKIWIVTFSQDPAVTVAGFRRTMTLWNDFPVPDREQPVWDLFRWRETIPSPRARD